MTTFHDPQPQSRRAARQSERERVADQQSPTEGFTTFPAKDVVGEDAYRSAPPPSPQTQYSHFAPPEPPPGQVSSVEQASSAEQASSVSETANPGTLTAAEEDSPERTLTRRELRELRARQEAEVAPAVAALTVESETPVYLEPPALIDPLAVVPEAASSRASSEDALSAFESLLANADGSAKDAATNAAPPSPLVDVLRGVSSSASASTIEEPQKLAGEPQPEAQHTMADLFGFDPGSSNAHSAPTADETVANLSTVRREFDDLARKRLDGELLSAEVAPAAPTGHWSRQAAADDEPSGSIISRTIGSGTNTTSALVLPSIPFATDIRGLLNSHGEPVLTGSIDLPSTLSASGVSDRFDRSDIDSLLDLNDSDIVSTDSAPVRAVTAVSTFSNQAVTQTQKPKGTRALTVLLISAASMAVVVAGLLVAAFAFNML